MRYETTNQKEDAMETKATWTTSDGRTAEVTVTLITSKALDADGDKITVPCCEMEITATVNGEQVGYGYPQAINHPVAVAMIGKLGISKANMVKVEAAINEIKATPEWQAKTAREEQNRKDEIEYDKHYAKMRKIMTE